MSEKKAPDKLAHAKGTQKSAKSATAIGKTFEGFTDEERAAMKARAREMKAEARRGAKKADGESDLLAAMPAPGRAMGEAETLCRTVSCQGYLS
jgi:hypothetical protein